MTRIGRLLAVWLGLSLAAVTMASAEAPGTSPRPLPRAIAERSDPAPTPAVTVPRPRPSARAGWEMVRAPAPADPQAGTPPPQGSGWLAMAIAGVGQDPQTRSQTALLERASTSGVLASPRPPPRTLADAAALRPRPRPASLVRPRNPASRVAIVQPATQAAVLRSPRPEPRPENHLRRSIVRASGLVPTQPSPNAIIGRRGSVCGDRRIRGEALAPIAGRIRGCGLEAPVRVTEVDGVRLSKAATIDCTTAKALTEWVSGTVKPTVGRLGGGVASLQVFADYSCRTRNNQPGAKISEHGRGRAIDIGAINLANGSSLTVLDHWRSDDLGPLLRAMHRGACGPFGTVLGPKSDRFHQNHFHLDTARYRSGSYCR